MGAVYTHTSSGAPLRRTAAAAGAAREGVLARYYDPHHARLDGLQPTRSSAKVDASSSTCTRSRVGRFPTSRTTPSRALRSASERTPCTHPSLSPQRRRGSSRTPASRLFATSRSRAPSSPGRFYRVDGRVISVMIEIRRDLYMDERSGDQNAGFTRIVALLAEFVAEIAAPIHSSIASATLSAAERSASLRSPSDPT